MRIILARVFLERAIHAFIRSQVSFPTASRAYTVCVYKTQFGRASPSLYTGIPYNALVSFSLRVFRTIEPYMHFSIPSPTIQTTYNFSSRHVLRMSHTCVLPFRSPLFQPRAYQLFNYYFGSRIFRTSHTCVIPLLFRLTC